MLCVDRPITLDVTWWYHPRRFLRNIWRSTCSIESLKLRVATVHTILHDDILWRVPWMSRINAWVLARQLNRMIRSIAPDNAQIIQWVYRPEQGWVRWVFPDAALVYECYDEYSYAPDGSALPKIWKLESVLLRAADLTLVTATALLERRRGLAKAIHLIPNGIPDCFLDEPRPLADSIDGITRPRIGYVGVIRKPMHMSLLRSVFEKHPDWQLVLVGPVQNDSGIEVIRGLPNVHIVGPRPFELLPAIMRKLDVGLIPHQINPFSEGLRPLKLAEYLSAGIPVVATRLPELSGMDALISFYDDNELSFAEAIANALNRRGSEFCHEALAWACEFTWRRIAERDVIPALKESFLL